MIVSQIGEKLDIWIVRVYGVKEETEHKTYEVGRNKQEAKDRAFKTLHMIDGGYNATGVIDVFTFTQNGWIRIE